MKKVCMFFTILLVLSLMVSACDNKEISNMSEETVAITEYSESLSSINEPKAEILQTVVYTIPEYYDGVYVAAEVKNTCDYAIEIDEFKCSFDLEDSDGTFIYHMDNITVAPKVLMPGEIGYLVKTDCNKTIDINRCKSAVVNLFYDFSSKASAQIPVDDNAISEYSGFFYATPGRLINDFAYELKNVIAITAFYGTDHKFLGVNVDYNVDVPGNDKLGFSGESYNPIPLSAFPSDVIEETVSYGSYELLFG